jgi:hypothetical protein
VNCAANFLFGQSDDYTFDLPPMAEAQDVPPITARFGTGRGLEAGVVPIGFEQQRCIGQRSAAIDEGRVHKRVITDRTLRFRSQTRSTNR